LSEVANWHGSQFKRL